MKVRVGYLIYTVSEANPKFMDTHGGTEEPEEDMIVWGRHEPKLQAIFLRAGQSAERQAATLIHELMHAMYEAYQIDERRTEENTISSLDTPFIMLMQDNPGLFGKIEAAALGDRPLFPEIERPGLAVPDFPKLLREGAMPPQVYKELMGYPPACDVLPSSMQAAAG